MFKRLCFGLIFTAASLIPFAGCGTSEVDSIQISPASQSLTAGQTAQLTVSGSYGHGQNHPASVKDVTSLVSWTSSAPAVATVSSGLVTAVSAGTTTITASMKGFTGVITASATITVTGTTTSGGSGDVVSLSIIPGTQSVASPNQSSQFLAIGTTSAGATLNLTSQVTWTSSSLQVATIGNAGLATAVAKGIATFTAVYTNPDSTVATGTAIFTVTNGTSEPITALSIIPTSQSLSVSQAGQFVAIGTSGTTGVTEDVTNSKQLTWNSSISTVATITSGQATGNGLATGVSAGSSNISAVWTNPDGSVVTATASVTVAVNPAPEPLLSITVMPTTSTVNNLLGTGQFLAYGTFSTAPTVMDITNGVNHDGFTSPVTWISSAPEIFPVNSYGVMGATGGLVTAVGSGATDIYAVATNPDGTLVYSSPVAFNCPYVAYVPADPTATPPTQEVLGSCNSQTVASGLLVTLTVFNAGLNTKDWAVTAPSATGTPNVIHCGPGWTGAGGQVCMATYPLGTKVILTASGGAFGGWSWNCTPSDVNGNPLPGPTYWTAAGPNYCTIYLGTDYTTNPPSSNESVGAIFN